VKVTVDAIDGDGNPVHNEWTGKYGGKDYPVTGDSSTDTRSYKKVNDRLQPCLLWFRANPVSRIGLLWVHRLA